MKAWEKKIIEDRKNLWVVTTENANIVCTRINGQFYAKSPSAELVEPKGIRSYIKIKQNVKL